MYAGAATQVRSSVGITEEFEVKVGLHQGSALSPNIFDLLIDVKASDVREEVPLSALFADDIVLIDRAR